MNDLSFLTRYKELRKQFYPNRPVAVQIKEIEPEPEPEPEPLLRDILLVSSHTILAEQIERLPAQSVRIEPIEGAQNMTFKNTPVWVVRAMLQEVAEASRLTPEQIVGQQRNVRIVAARHYLMWRLRRETTWSLPQIGRFLGGRDHTTVLHGIRSWEKKISESRNALS
jgi:hypothetical protein